ncbi:MAG: hypothetical protein LBQ68_06125, partial [Clostridiales bacterium]|nr:hypothetical protein [Clostridiales bacterium]
DGLSDTYAVFSSGKIRDRFTPTSLQAILQFMSENTDSYLVTDTKSFEYTTEQMLTQFKVLYDSTIFMPSLRDRIIIQIYNQDMYYKINEIYKYPNILYTLYLTPDSEKQVLEFVKKERIPVVVMPPERANEAFVNNLNKLGVRIYLHTLNDLSDVKNWMTKGIWGVYTDSLLPNDFMTQ